MPPASTVDAAQVPRAVDDMAHGVVGQGYQREKVGLDDVAVRIGTTPIRISGIIAEMPRIFVVLAERKMPPSGWP